MVFSARPARVKTIIPVALPQPRPLEMRLAPEFSAIKRIVWAELGLG